MSCCRRLTSGQYLIWAYQHDIFLNYWYWSENKIIKRRWRDYNSDHCFIWRYEITPKTLTVNTAPTTKAKYFIFHDNNSRQLKNIYVQLNPVRKKINNYHAINQEQFDGRKKTVFMRVFELAREWMKTRAAAAEQSLLRSLFWICANKDRSNRAAIISRRRSRIN